MAKAAELMRTIAAVVSPAAYVGLVQTAGGIVARVYTEDGETLQDIGPFAGSVGSISAFAFVRGESEGSLAGCAVAWQDGADLFVFDLEGEALEEVATTGRPAEAGGFTWGPAIKAGASSFIECGLLGQIGGVLPASASSYVMWVRTIGIDGITIASVGTQSGHPLSSGASDEIQGLGPPLLVGASTWAATFTEGDEEGSDINWSAAVKTATDAATFAEITDRYDDNGSIAVPGPSYTIPVPAIGLVLAGDPVMLWSDGSFQISRVVLDASPGYYAGSNSRYVREDLLDLAEGGAISVGTMRTSGDLVALDGTASTATHLGSRLCTYSGTHPVTDSDEGPAFERDDATESLVVVFGL